MTWKLALNDFIHNRNQMEIDYNPDPLKPYVADGRFLEAEAQRQDRRRRLHRERGLEPVKGETRLKVKGLEAEAESVAADIQLVHTYEYRIRDRTYREQRLTLEKVILSPKGGKWQVRQVDPQSTESAYGNPFVQTEETGEGVWQGGLGEPYLHPDVVPGSQPADWLRGTPYNREKARFYADTWWNGYNPRFLRFEVDCSNYVSQCLFAGGAPMNYTGKRETGWWYRGKSGNRELWSYSWAVANSLRLYLSASRGGLHAEIVDSPRKLAIGDVISYSWDGDGRFGHSTVVTGFDANGMPLVNAHTVNSRNRYWDYRDSYAWTERTVYRFFHIPDVL